MLKTGLTLLKTNAPLRVSTIRILSFTSRLCSETKIYDFERMKQLVQHPSKNRVLVDAREPEEFKTYSIPNSVNIPFTSDPEAMKLSPEAFEEKYNFKKPEKSQELVFFCKKGRRAEAAEQIARSCGFENTAVYPGSMDDWVANGGMDIKPSE